MKKKRSKSSPNFDVTQEYNVLSQSAILLLLWSRDADELALIDS